jgi:hypothetical protein
MNRTPTRLAERQATSQERFKSSGLIMSMKVFGRAAARSQSIIAPVEDRLRMVQSTVPIGSEIEPPLNVRDRGDPRLFSMGNSYTPAQISDV